MMQSQVFVNALLSHAKVAGEERRMEKLKYLSVRKAAAKVISSFLKKQMTKIKELKQHVPSVAQREDGINSLADSKLLIMVPTIIKIFKIQKASELLQSRSSKVRNHQTTSLQTMMKPLNSDFRDALCLVHVVI